MTTEQEQAEQAEFEQWRIAAYPNLNEGDPCYRKVRAAWKAATALANKKHVDKLRQLSEMLEKIDALAPRP